MISASLVEILERPLSQKPYKRIYWWSTQCWNTVVVLSSPLTKENPLWCRTDEELSGLRLLGLNLEELKKVILQYWKKPRWQQWLWRLFSNIDIKIEFWFYYQKCLAFREIRPNALQYIGINFFVNMPVFEQEIKILLIDWMQQRLLQFETYTEKQCRLGPWTKNKLESMLSEERINRRKVFFKKIKQVLILLPKHQRDFAERYSDDSYKHIDKILQNYLSRWHNNLSNSFYNFQTSHQELFQEQSVVLYAANSSIPAVSYEAANVLNPQINSIIENWSKLKRQAIKDIFLKDVKNRGKRIEFLLENSLKNLDNFIEPQMKCHRERMRVMKRPRLKNLQPVLDITLCLEKDLKKLYHHITILFHPDHYYDLFKKFKTDELACYWNQLFIRFSQKSFDNLSELQSDKDTLELWCEPPGKPVQELIREYKKIASEQDKKRSDEWEAEREKLKIQLEELKAKFKKEFKTIFNTVFKTQFKLKLEETVNEKINQEVLKNADQIAAHFSINPEQINLALNQESSFKPW